MDISLLYQYIPLVREIARLQAEYDELSRGNVGAVRITGMPKQKGQVGDGVFDTVALMDKVTARKMARINELLQLKATIDEAIGSLSDVREREVVTYRFVDGLSVLDVSIRMNYSYSRVMQLQRSALAKLKKK